MLKIKTREKLFSKKEKAAKAIKNHEKVFFNPSLFADIINTVYGSSDISKRRKLCEFLGSLQYILNSRMFEVQSSECLQLRFFMDKLTVEAILPIVERKILFKLEEDNQLLIILPAKCKFQFPTKILLDLLTFQNTLDELYNHV